MTDRILNELSGSHFFLTGATGFIGKYLLESIRDSNDIYHTGISATVLSRDPDKFLKKFPEYSVRDDFDFVKGDVRTFCGIWHDIDYIIHAAAPIEAIISDAELQPVIVDGTRHIIEFAKHCEKLKNFLYISSGAVYGNSNTKSVNEGFPCSPVAVYGKSKLEAERLCLESGLPCSIARCFAFVGEYLPVDAHFAIGNFIRDCLNNKDILIKGDGTPLRSYLYAGDLSQWLWTILKNGKNGDAYNVGSDFSVSIAELASIVRKVAGTNNKIQILTPPSGGPPQCYVPDISKARQKLGLEVKTSLEEAIKRTIDFHKGKK